MEKTAFNTLRSSGYLAVPNSIINFFGSDMALFLSYVNEQRTFFLKNKKCQIDGSFFITIEGASNRLKLSPRAIRLLKKSATEMGIIRVMGLHGVPPKEFIIFNDELLKKIINENCGQIMGGEPEFLDQTENDDDLLPLEFFAQKNDDSYILDINDELDLIDENKNSEEIILVEKTEPKLLLPTIEDTNTTTPEHTENNHPQVISGDLFSSITVPQEIESNENIKETKKDKKNKKNRDPQFQEFYKMYPRHNGPIDAEKAWNSQIKSGATPELIMDALSHQLPELLNREEHFRPLPATWLRKGHWLNEVASPPKTIANDIDFKAESEKLTKEFWKTQTKIDAVINRWVPDLSKKINGNQLDITRALIGLYSYIDKEQEKNIIDVNKNPDKETRQKIGYPSSIIDGFIDYVQQDWIKGTTVKILDPTGGIFNSYRKYMADRDTYKRDPLTGK